jgi:hypothetical protein
MTFFRLLRMGSSNVHDDLRPANRDTSFADEEVEGLKEASAALGRWAD